MVKLKKKSPYSFETYLNNYGNTVVYLKKGKQKVWLFNITDGYIDFSVVSEKGMLEKLGIKVQSDGLPCIDGYATEPNIIKRIDQIEERFAAIFKEFN